MIVTRKPLQYITQPFYRFCGACQIAQILDLKKNYKIQYRKVFSWISGITWFCNPYQVFYKCKEHDLHPSFHTWGSIQDIIQSLKQGKIPILFIGHAYNEYGVGFKILKAIFFQHYISVHGYDEVNRGFYVYDSSVKNKDSNLPVWNVFVDEELLLKCRNWWRLSKHKRIFISI